MLQFFNFGPSLQKWVQILYCDIESCIIQNGWMSNYFKITRGIRQGCPLSALLFVIAVETLALKIRNDENIHGITISNGDSVTEIKSAQFADDTTVFVRDKNSIENVLLAVSEFTKVAGPELNMKKTEGLWLGKTNDNTFMEIQWAQKPVKYLGIYFGRDKNKLQELNWINKVIKLKQIINNWKVRQITIFGRITIAKSLGISQILYNASVLETPKQVIKTINKLLFNFIWKSKIDKVKRNTIIGNFDDGGLKMVDIESQIKALKIMWVKRICDTTNGSWKVTVKYVLHLCGGVPLIFNFNCFPEDFDKIADVNNISMFYIEMLKSWFELKEERDTTFFADPIEIKNQIIWGNSLINLKGKPLLFHHWIKSGFIFIGDIWKEEFLPVRDIRDKLINTNNYIAEIVQIKASIPHAWKTTLRTVNLQQFIVPNTFSNDIFIHMKDQSVELKNIKSKVAYNIFVNKKKCINKKQYYWENYFDSPINFTWTSIWNFKLKEIAINKYREFNVKFLNNLLPNKVNLLKWNVSQNNVCDTCNTTEDLEHYIFKCKVLNLFWDKIRNLIHSISDGNICVNFETPS